MKTVNLCPLSLVHPLIHIFASNLRLEFEPIQSRSIVLISFNFFTTIDSFARVGKSDGAPLKNVFRFIHRAV